MTREHFYILTNTRGQTAHDYIPGLVSPQASGQEPFPLLSLSEHLLSSQLPCAEWPTQADVLMEGARPCRWRRPDELQQEELNFTRSVGLLVSAEALVCRLHPFEFSLTASTSSTLLHTGWLVP